MTRLAICGGTSLGHALAAVLGADPANDVRVLTRQPQRWSGTVRGFYLDKAEIVGRQSIASADPADVLAGAEIVFICIPFPFRAAVLRRIAPWIEPDAWIGGIPGFAGFDWEARSILGSGARLFGLQRVPYVRKTISYGEAVWISGIRPKTYLASLPAAEAPVMARTIGALLSTPVEPLPNYFPVTLSASNAIFHPARLFSAFSRGDAGIAPAQFYEDWDDAASEAYLALDAEVQAMAEVLPLDTSGAIPIKRHFGIDTPRQLTTRIRSIRALRDRPLPVRAGPNGYRPDLQSYYFTEDARFSFIVLRSLADVLQVSTPFMDQVLEWIEEITDAEILVDGLVKGRSAAHLPTPLNLSINSAAALAEAAV